IAARQRAKFSSVGRAAVVSDLTPERRWRIVLARDRRYDGAFVYAVQSTGIYCRPSCPSRRPRRAQVAFFPVPEAAELAGFRPCRRCRPGEAAPPDPGVPLVRTVCRLIDAHPDRPASLAALSAQAGMTSHRLLRTFQRVLGISPRQYRDARRVDRFKAELRARGRVSPAWYEAGLAAEFPSAQLRRDRGALAASVGGLLRYLDGRAEPLDLPLDVRATAFQRRVWEALRRIPYGTTRSYTEIARAIRKPSATRAVARACATNPAALVIPCHRVVRADGGLGGYRWGVARKRALLEQERAGTVK